MWRHKTVDMGLFLAFALLLSYVETLIPFAIGLPGVKIGLANLAVVLCLYVFSMKEAFMLTILKAVLATAMFGNGFMMLYSIAGAALSCAVMGILKRTGKLHLPVVSAVGGVTHNMAQLLVASLVIQTYRVLYYVPFLIIAGIVMGLVNGSIASCILPYIKKIIKNRERL